VNICVISDIHGNLPALKAILKSSAAKKARRFFFLGDFLGYSPFPNETVSLLRKNNNTISIIGNYDLKVLRRKRSKDAVKDFSFSWTHKHTSPEAKRYLQTLPEQRMTTVCGKKILLVHGSTFSNEEGIDENSPLKKLRRIARTAGADIILCGHTHRPFVKKVGAVWFINPGGAGRSFDSDTASSYAMLSITSKAFKVKFYRLAYPLKKVIIEMHKKKFPYAIRESLMLAQSLDDLKSIEDPKEAAQKIMRLYECELPHARQVAKLSILLFNRLKALHRLGKRKRLILECAALMHDAGAYYGKKEHHRISCEIILNTALLPFETKERLLTALIARYHRRALPNKTHSYFSSLGQKDKHEMLRLAALLRLADALDHSHRQLVRDIRVEKKPRKVVLKIGAKGFSKEDYVTAYKKADLFKMAFGLKTVIDWH